MAGDDYGWLCWGVNVTSSNNQLEFDRAGAGPFTASLDTTAADLPDWVPVGNDSTNYDLLKSLADAMTTADAGGTYTATLASDATTGMNGRVTITETGSSAVFEINWSNSAAGAWTAATTVDPAWFGYGTSLVFGTQTTANSTGAATYTGTYHSELIWTPQVPIWDQWVDPNARSLSVQRRTISGKYVTRRLNRRGPVYSQDWSTLIAEAGFSGALGGTVRMFVDNLTHDFIHPQDIEDGNDLNKSLAVWHEHASQGKWFILFHSNAGPGIDGDTRATFCRLTDDAMRDDFGAVAVKQQRFSPQLWTVDVPFTAIDISDLAADGG